jgi:hypothetical protein
LLGGPLPAAHPTERGIVVAADDRPPSQGRRLNFSEGWKPVICELDAGGLADVERDLIRTRTAEGRSRARKRRQHMGRPPKLTATQHADACRRRAEGATLTELARSYGVGKGTISRLET